MERMYQEDMGGRSPAMSEPQHGDEDNQLYYGGVSNTADTSTHRSLGTESITGPAGMGALI